MNLDRTLFTRSDNKQMMLVTEYQLKDGWWYGRLTDDIMKFTGMRWKWLTADLGKCSVYKSFSTKSRPTQLMTMMIILFTLQSVDQFSVFWLTKGPQCCTTSLCTPSTQTCMYSDNTQSTSSTHRPTSLYPLHNAHTQSFLIFHTTLHRPGKWGECKYKIFPVLTHLNCRGLISEHNLIWRFI